VTIIGELGPTPAVTSNRRTLRRNTTFFIVTAVNTSHRVVLSTPSVSICAEALAGGKMAEEHNRLVSKLRMAGARLPLPHTVHGVLLNYTQGQLHINNGSRH
jgi:hypothetical protein